MPNIAGGTESFKMHCLEEWWCLCGIERLGKWFTLRRKFRGAKRLCCSWCRLRSESERLSLAVEHGEVGRKPIPALACASGVCMAHCPLATGHGSMGSPYLFSKGDKKTMSLLWLRAYIGTLLFPHFLPLIFFSLLQNTSLLKCFKCKYPGLKVYALHPW